MRVLIIGKMYTEGFARHIADTFESMGMDITRYEPGLERQLTGGKLRQQLEAVVGYLHAGAIKVPAVRVQAFKQLEQVARECQPDLILTCYDFLWAREVEALKRCTGAKIAMWYPDHLANFGRSHFMMAPYDALFFKDPYIVEFLRDRLSSKIYYLPECFNPQVHRLPAAGLSDDDYEKYGCEVTTAGNMYAYRIATFQHLEQYDMKLWGGSAPNWLPLGNLGQFIQGEFVAGEEKAKAFRAADIVVNSMYPAEIWGLNCRAFEVAGIGGFMLIDWKPGLQQLFDDGTEIVSFRGTKDLCDKIDHYLEHPEERSDIAAAGQRRARAEHTYTHRLELLVDTVIGDKSGYPMPSISGIAPQLSA